MAKPLKVIILGDASDAIKAFGQVEGAADKAATRMERLSGKMSSVGKGLTMGVTAPLVAGAALATKAAAEEAQQMEVLAGVISERIPGATDAAIAANEEWVTSIQNTTAVADSDIREMEQSFLSAGASIEDAQRMTALAYDVAAATGKEATSVSAAFVKGINGQVSGLGRLGIATKNADGTTKSFNQIQEELAETMGGTAANAADTAAGRAEIMRLKMADLTEDLGMVLLPVLEKLTEWLSKVTDWFSNLSPEAKKMGVVFLGVAAAVGPLLLVGAKLVSAFGVISKAFTAMKLLMMANPWVLLIAAVVALVTIIVLNWDKIVAFLKKVWDWIVDKAAAVGAWLKDRFKDAVEFLYNLFLNFTPLGLIIKHFDKIKEVATGVGKWIKDKFDAVVDFFKRLPGRIGSAVSGMWDGLKTAFKSALNWLIDKWNNFHIPAVHMLGVQVTPRIDFPNIPKLHSGGMFRAPTPGGEGLALLKDRETVLPAGQGGAIYLTVNALDPNTAARVVVEALQSWNRNNGALPIVVRT